MKFKFFYKDVETVDKTIQYRDITETWQGLP